MSRWFQGPLILPDRVLEQGLLRVEGSRITGVWNLEQERSPAPDSKQTVKLERGYIAPGLIDLHVHGGGGADFMDGDPEAVGVITRTHARYGTTGLFATTLTAPERAIIRAVQAAQAAPKEGARLLGFHIEGPFINPVMKGSQDWRHIRLPSTAEIDRWMAAAGPGCRWHVTLAPETEGALAAIAHLAARGAVVSAGHTNCDYAQLKAAAAAGLRHVTHLFNAMRGLHHREPGAAGGALVMGELTAEVIADGLHVDPAVLALAAAAKGPERLILVSDAMRATGLGDGEYRLGDLPVTVRGNEARLADGTLAGSVLTMAGAVRNMVRLVGLPLAQAVRMASLNPARLHGLAGRKGALAAGYDADILLLDPELAVLQTVVEGETVFVA